MATMMDEMVMTLVRGRRMRGYDGRNYLSYLLCEMRGKTPLSGATDRKKAKKRHLTEGMTEKTLTDLTVLLWTAKKQGK
jgi:hypothetical protein